MFLQLLFLVSLVSSKFVKEEGIVVLNDDNFQKKKKNYPLLLVEFYAPVSDSFLFLIIVVVWSL